MSEHENVVIADGIFGTDSENFSQRVPCVVVVDCSHSMQGPPIESLNRGLKQFETELHGDDRARRSTRIMLIRVGGFEGGPQVMIRTPFQDAPDFTAPNEIASGSTPLGEGVLLALQKIEQEKAYLRSAGLSYLRPWLFVMSDGAPTDGETWEAACTAAITAAEKDKVSVFPIIVDGGNAKELQKLSRKHDVLAMNSAKFSEFFIWVSASISGASGSTDANPPMAKGLESWATA